MYSPPLTTNWLIHFLHWSKQWWKSSFVRVQTWPRIPSYSAENPTKYESPWMVRWSARFVFGILVFIVHTYDFVTLQDTIRGSACSCIHSLNCLCCYLQSRLSTYMPKMSVLMYSQSGHLENRLKFSPAVDGNLRESTSGHCDRPSRQTLCSQIYSIVGASQTSQKPRDSINQP